MSHWNRRTGSILTSPSPTSIAACMSIVIALSFLLKECRVSNQFMKNGHSNLVRMINVNFGSCYQLCSAMRDLHQMEISIQWMTSAFLNQQCPLFALLVKRLCVVYSSDMWLMSVAASHCSLLCRQVLSDIKQVAGVLACSSLLLDHHSSSGSSSVTVR